MGCNGCKYFFSEADIYKDKNLSKEEGVCNHPERTEEMRLCACGYSQNCGKKA
jgi:hypothetical protein